MTKPRVRRLPRWMWLGGGCYLLLVAAVAVVAIAAEVPTRLGPLQAEHAAFVQDEGRVRNRDGCSLSQVMRRDGSCRAATPSAVREVDVSFPSRLHHKRPSRLRGTLSLPQGLVGRRPGVVLMHGSGPQTRNALASGDLVRPEREQPFAILQQLAVVLSRLGLVVLRYDKRSCANCYGEGSFVPQSFRFSDYVDDARDALAYLKTRPEVDPHALVVVGHSQGGKLAPRLAHGDTDVVATVVLSAPTASTVDGLLAQFAAMQRLRARQWDWHGAREMRLLHEQYATCFAKLDGTYAPHHSCMPSGVTLAALAAERQAAAATTGLLKSLPCPLLVLHGALDRNVDPTVAKAIAAAVRGRDAEVHLIAGAGHLLNDLTDASSSPQFHPAVVTALERFVGSVKFQPWRPPA